MCNLPFPVQTRENGFVPYAPTVFMQHFLFADITSPCPPTPGSSSTSSPPWRHGSSARLAGKWSRHRSMMTPTPQCPASLTISASWYVVVVVMVGDCGQLSSGWWWVLGLQVLGGSRELYRLALVQ